MIVTRVNADRPPRTRVGHFNQPARFPPKRPRLLNRKGKHKLIRENSKSIRSTYLSTIGHFVKFVFKDYVALRAEKLTSYLPWFN